MFSALGASGGTATALGAGTLLAGGYMVGKGLSIGADTIKNWDKSSTTDKIAGLGTATLATGGGVAAGLGALGIASGPIGWAGLAIGGAALAGKAIYDHATRLSGLAEEYEAHGEELKSAFQKEQQTRIEESAFLKQRIKDSKNDTEAQNEIINSGLLSEKTARDLSAQELSVLTTEIIKTESAITALGNAAIDAKTKVAKEEAQQQTKDVLQNQIREFIRNLMNYKI